MFSNFFKFPIGLLTHPPTSKVFFDFWKKKIIYMAPKPGLYYLRRSTQTELRKRIYADTHVMALILLRRSRRVYADIIRNSGLRTISVRWIYLICRVKACVYAAVAAY